MAETSQKGGLMIFYRVILGFFGFLWVSVILAIVVSVVSNTVDLPSDVKAVLKAPFDWIFLNRLPAVLLLIIFALLAVMQQNSIELPKQRVELYTVVTRTLLENRNLIKNIKPIPEAQAIQRLGPIVYTMQKSGNSFARQQDVKEALRDIIQQEEKGGTAEEVAQEVESFLSRIRERGSLFVIRTGDYFGFFHRTFQEYFAARYILNQRICKAVS